MRRLTVGEPSEFPDLVFVPGLGACGYLLPTVHACSEWARVHLLDLPGFGHRRTARCPSRLEDVAADVAAWLAMGAADRPPVVLFGHSTGAQAALLAASRVPQAVATLVLAGPTFPPQLRRWRSLVGPTALTLWREPSREIAGLAPYYLRGRSRMLRLLRTALPDTPEESVERYAGRLVVLRGVRDPFCTAEWAARLSAGAAQEMPGAHNFPYTHPVETSRVLRRLAAEVG